jgi:hypothetical protein
MRPLGRPKCIREHTIKMAWGGMDWIARAQDKDRWLLLVIAVVNFQVS